MFNVGDIVTYEPLDKECNPKFRGNRMMIREVSSYDSGKKRILQYSVNKIDPIPFTAWHEEDTLKLYQKLKVKSKVLQEFYEHCQNCGAIRDK